jgi:fructose-1,6-bisphosphatase/inositol monophosphatase family enzyme
VVEALAEAAYRGIAELIVASIDPQGFVETMLPVVRQCAEASLIFYGRVANLGKRADTSLTGTMAQNASAAFTAIDGAVQDIILGVALQHFTAVRCIAEENTPLKRRFRGSGSDYALILDPIDGTLHFQKGDAPYHISLGLAHQGTMVASIVSRPTEDKLFTATRGEGAYLQHGSRRRRQLTLPPAAASKRAFISSKARQYQQAAKPRLDPREYPIGAALVLTLMAEGKLSAYLTRQVEVHDVGPPSLIAEEAGAICFLRRGRTPYYRARRKFSFYMAAADTDLQQFLRTLVEEVN